jgi:endonuclease/exonuclease/phosphatase family metal-dependent hydrolase
MSNIKIIFQLFCLLFLSCSEQEEYIFNPGDSIFNSSLNVVGQDNTLDIITWNIEHFPKNNLTNLYVKQVIDSLNVDIIGFQEIESTFYFNDLLDSLGNHWDGFRSGENSSNYQELAYLINTSKVEILSDPYTILNSYQYEFAYREPLVLRISYDNEDLVLINVHYKCCDGHEDRRLQASVILHEYINLNFINSKVIVLGDFNDMLTDGNNNIFSPFLSDMNNFYFTDFSIANSSNEFWSFPSWPSHLDHILITNELFNYIVDTQTVLIDWSLIGGLSAYDTYVSDHRPVIVKILFNE